MKYVPGLLAGQLSGKAGNTVASRNKFGSYFRTRTIPKLVQNGKTGPVRANFGANSQAYRGLTDAQRASWAAFGSSITRQNTLGQTYTLTGSQAFNLINRNLFTISQASVIAVPAATVPPAIVTSTITATSV